MGKRPNQRNSFVAYLAGLHPATLVDLWAEIAEKSKSMDKADAGESAIVHKLIWGKWTAQELYLFRDYRDKLGKEIAKLSLNEDDDISVLVTLYKLEEAASDEKTVNILEQSLPEDFKASRTESGPFDFVTRVFLEAGNTDLIKKAIHVRGVVKPKSYKYFVPAYRASLACPLIKPDDAGLDRAEGILQGDFAELLKSKLCELSFTEGEDDKWYFDVIHSGNVQQGEKDGGHEQRLEYMFKGVEYDTIVFDKKTGDLMIHLQQERTTIRDSYLHTLSYLLFNCEDYWSKTKKYDLTPLSAPRATLKKTVLQLGTLEDKNPKLLSVGLTKVSLSKTIQPNAELGKPANSSMIRSNSACLTHELAEGESLEANDYKIQSAILTFFFSHKGKEPLRLNITLSADGRNIRGGAEIAGLDDWLREVNLTRLGESLEERRAAFLAHPDREEAKPKKTKHSKRRMLLFEQCASSYRRIPKPKD